MYLVVLNVKFNDLFMHHFVRILLAKLYCTHFIGTTFFTVRNFVVTTSPSNATNKNCEKVMIFPAPGSFLFSENKIIRSTNTHAHYSIT